MHRLWNDYLASRPPLSGPAADLIVPIGETLPDVSIIPAERSHGKSWSGARTAQLPPQRDLRR